MPFINTVLQYFEPIAHGLLALGLLLCLWVEGRWPLVGSLQNRASRWQTNIGIYVLGAVFMALAYEPLNTLAIEWGALPGWGGLAATDWPTWVKIVLGLLVIDLFQYLLHAASHHVPWWWRLHKIHHSDTSMDASTAIRHHPLETLVNAFLLVLLMAASGMPVYAIFLYAALQELHALFCHANVGVPPGVDKYLRYLVVTPDMHAVHHSVRMDEGNSNFGMVFPWWDRIFRSYCAVPQGGRPGMRLGLAELQAAGRLDILRLLGLPLRRQEGGRVAPAQAMGRTRTKARQRAMRKQK